VKKAVGLYIYHAYFCRKKEIKAKRKAKRTEKDMDVKRQKFDECGMSLSVIIFISLSILSACPCWWQLVHSSWEKMLQFSLLTPTHYYYYYFASAAVTLDSSRMTASSSGSWSGFSLPSNFLMGTCRQCGS